MKKKWIALVLIMGGCIAAMMSLSGCGTTKIDLGDYVEISFEGYDGYGTVDVDLDRDALEDKYGKKLKLNDNAEEWGYSSVSEVICDMYGVSASPTSGLSNGDEVIVELYEDWYDAGTFIEGDIEVSLDSVSFEVSGLEEVSEADIFDGVTVTFSGTAPNASAEIEVTGALSASWFTLDQSSGLNAGDVVTVSVSESAIESIIEATGTIPSDMSKQFEVEGVAHYASSLDEIPSDAITKMENQAKDTFDSYVADSWESELTSLTSFEYIGSYFLNNKGYDSWYEQNIIILVYEYHANQSGEDVTMYWYCRFYDAILLEDGTFSIDYSNYDVPEGGWFNGETSDYTDSEGNTLTYRGYSDLDSMFNQLVTTNVENYTYESTVEE